MSDVKIGDDFHSAEAARTALCDSGFSQGFSSPGRPMLWVCLKKHSDRRAVKRLLPLEGAELWRIVPYPEPATCTPSELGALLRRDGGTWSDGSVGEPASESLSLKVHKLAQKWGVSTEEVYARIRAMQEAT
jgi:hypothetical protein